MSRALLPWLGVALLTALAVEGSARLALSSDAFLRQVDGATPTGRRLASQHRARKALAQDREALSRVGAGRLRFDPDLGWVPRPGEHAPQGRRTVIGPDGLRHTGPPRRGAPLLLVGDSFTFGDEVADDETWAWHLADDLDRPVLNGGVLSYGLGQTVLRAEALLDEHAPAQLVVGVTSVMLVRTDLSWDAWRKPRFTLQDGSLVPPDTPLPAPEALLAPPPSAALALARVWTETLTGDLTDLQPVRPLLDALVARLVAQADVPVLWVYLPVAEELTRPPRAPAMDGQAWLAQRCATDGLACLDPTERLRQAHAEGIPLVRGAHWSPEAHRLLAEAVATHLASRQAGGPEAPP